MISPVGFDFGTYDVGSGDPPPRHTFAITNKGAGAATLTTIAVGGPAAADFVLAANSCGETLAPADTCNVRIDFIAIAAGDREASLQIMGSTSPTAALSRQGIAPPSRIRFSPGARNFGDVPTGTTGAPFTFTVTNEAAATTLIPSLVGVGAAAFRIASTDCTSGVLQLGATCSLTVEMVPPFGGEYVADVVLTQPNGATAQAGLTGVSTTPLAVTPPSSLFGSYLLGQPTPGTRITFTATNTGTTTTGPLTATLIGVAAADFTIQSTTCTMLAPAATCDVVVELTPLTRGGKVAQLSVKDSVAETRVGLRGNAYSLLVTGTAVFPDTELGQQSAIQTFNVSNASNLATGAITTTRGGTDASQFTVVSTTCAAGIPANNGCTISVRFTPTSAGPKSATLNVSATPGGSDSVAITGRGL